MRTNSEFRIGRRVGALSGAAVVTAALATTQALAQDDRRWSATGLKENVVVADCEECGDDLGMMIVCKGADRPAEVTVHWAATETGTANASEPITFSVNGQPLTYQANTIHYGQIGYTPEFPLPPGDPLIDALQSGATVTVGYRGDSFDIPLTDAAVALDIFKAHCGWSTAAAYTVSAGNHTGTPIVPVAAQSGLNATDATGYTETVDDDTAQQPLSTQGVEVAQATPQQVTVTLFNALDQPVDYFYIDPAGQPQFLYTLAPGERVNQPSNPGLELAFGVNGQEIAVYTTTSAPTQDFTVDQRGLAVSPAQPPVPAGQQPTTEETYSDGEQLVWSYYAGEPGGATLIYGIPETDASVLVVSCEPGQPAASAEFLASPHAGLAGQIATVTMTTASGPMNVVAYVNSEGRPVAKVGPQDPLWTALLTPGQADITIAGQSGGTVASLAGSTEAGSFFSQCGWT